MRAARAAPGRPWSSLLAARWGARHRQVAPARRGGRPRPRTGLDGARRWVPPPQRPGPLRPLVGALTRFLANRSLAQQRVDLQGCAWLVRLLPELAGTAVVPAPSWQLPPGQERRLLFGAVVRFLANVAGPAGTLLILDDLQWAGDDALDLLAALVRAPSWAPSGSVGSLLPLRVVGAYRDTEVAP